MPMAGCSARWRIIMRSVITDMDQRACIFAVAVADYDAVVAGHHVLGLG